MSTRSRPSLRAERDQQAQLPELGAVLKEYRKNNGLTQQELGELLQVDQSYVSKIERGKPVRDVEFLLRVTRVLDVPPAHLGLSAALLPSADRSAGASVQPNAQLPDSVAASQDEWRNV